MLGQQESVACIITFRPPDTKLYTSSITIKSNDPDEAEVVVPISAQAVECPTAVAVRVDEEEFAPFDTIRLDGRGSFTTAEGTFNHDGDAYFSNRLPEQTPTTPSWSLNLDENPRLDHDDARGYGPENVNIKHPAPGTRWTVYVHYWNAQAAAEAATATLRVYVFGRQAIELSQSFESDQLMWKALEIVWGDDPLASPVLTQLGQVNPYVRPF